jgi:hypothetical protein
VCACDKYKLNSPFASKIEPVALENLTFSQLFALQAEFRYIATKIEKALRQKRMHLYRMADSRTSERIMGTESINTNGVQHENRGNGASASSLVAKAQVNMYDESKIKYNL